MYPLPMPVHVPADFYLIDLEYLEAPKSERVHQTTVDHCRFQESKGKLFLEHTDSGEIVSHRRSLKRELWAEKRDSLPETQRRKTEVYLRKA